jgi:hypothetical protein
MLVLVSGYEGGYDNIGEISISKVIHTPGGGYDGEFDYADYPTPTVDRTKIIEAVVIPR